MISAISLPVGSAIGVTGRLNSRVVSSLMAFGAGALLFALTIEIVAHSFERAGFAPLAAGCVIGGVLYELLNHGLNQTGAFFRKTATLLRETGRRRRQRARDLVDNLSRVPVFSRLGPDEIADVVPHLDEIKLNAGEVVFVEGTRPDALYVIESGRVEIILGQKSVAKLGPGEIFGEIGLLADRPRTASAVAVRDSKVYRIAREHFHALLTAHPELNQPLGELMEERGIDLVRKSLVSEERIREWRRSAAGTLKDYDFSATSLDMKLAARKHGNASLGIWLGILLDGIPESLVIGLSVSIDRGLPWALVAGVFLSNLPEALSSSALMRRHDYSRLRILLMWTSITVMTAVGALVGNLFFQDFSREFIAVIEGMAAGAMLTMISETMLPEAYEQGGVIIGLSTLAGFLASLLVKALSA